MVFCVEIGSQRLCAFIFCGNERMEPKFIIELFISELEFTYII